MCNFNVFLFLIMLCVAKSEVDPETMCKNDYRDKENNTIDVLEYCSDKLCIQKCCGPDEIMFFSTFCNKISFLDKMKKYPHLKAQYNTTNILSSLDVNNKVKRNYVFVQNQRNSKYLLNCTAAHPVDEKYEILEDGSLRVLVTEESEEKWYESERLTYCIDYNVERIYSNNKTNLTITTIIREILLDQSEMKKIEKFETVGILISSLFLLLVLVVYCLLPDLRNLTGLVLMAYTLSLLVAFITKLIMTYLYPLFEPPQMFCKIISPVVYFAIVSSIFWLSVYAFDVWWGLRGFRINRKSKHSMLVKFMWYALYAWGTPLLLTALIVVLDNIPNLKLVVKTPFGKCLYAGKSFDYYYKVPIGILIVINIILFCMTVYNIWMVKRAVNKCHDSGRSKQQNNKFATYAKLCLMMGVMWFLELLPPENELWLYILLNLCNLLTGLIIFYLFVCKKIILLQLCQKFNIRNKYVTKLELEFTQKRTQSRTTRSTGLSSTVRRRSKDQPQDMDPLQNCPKGETTVV